MKLYRMDNTEGYTQDELDAINREWQEIVGEMELEEYTDEYDERAKDFDDEVARRQ